MVSRLINRNTNKIQIYNWAEKRSNWKKKCHIGKFCTIHHDTWISNKYKTENRRPGSNSFTEWYITILIITNLFCLKTCTPKFTFYTYLPKTHITDISIKTYLLKRIHSLKLIFCQTYSLLVKTTLKIWQTHKNGNVLKIHYTSTPDKNGHITIYTWSKI
jgi:hypothetical protein